MIVSEIRTRIGFGRKDVECIVECDQRQSIYESVILNPFELFSACA